MCGNVAKLKTFICCGIVLFSVFDISVGRSLANSNEIDLSSYGSKLIGTPDENVGKLLLQLQNDTHRRRPEQMGTYFQGDILMPKTGARNLLIKKAYRWPNAEVPFKIIGDFPPEDLQLIQDVMQEYHDRTCIKFVHKDSSHDDYIGIDSKCTGCWSMIGDLKQGMQIVNLQKRNCGDVPPGYVSLGCVGDKETPMHEFMHALGFDHEHNRFDRDKYITILRENIEKGEEDQFDKRSPKQFTTFNMPYNYLSIMHYDETAFSKDITSLITMKAKNKKFQKTMGKSEDFQDDDVEKIWKAYNCRKTTSSTGYVMPPITGSKDETCD